jgi:hypothetical protein
MSTLEKALAPNSDQLNADDLIAGPITCTITAVRIKEATGKGQQPIEVDLAEYPRPYRPCKSMGRLLLYVWGVESLWVGKRLTLYRDDAVQFGGDKVGGIRISHVSDLGARQKDISLTATRGKKAIFTVRQLEEKPSTKPRIDAIRQALKDLWPGDENAAMRQKIYTDNGVANPGKNDWPEQSIASLEAYIVTENEDRKS